MKKALVVSLFLLAVVVLGSPAALAQNCSSAPNNGWGSNYSSYAAWCSACGGTPSNNGGVGCTQGPNWGRSAGNSPGVNPNLYNGLNQAGYQLGYALGRWLFSSGSNPQAELQKQQMMAELQRRQAEAERQHREEEARQLAAMYNRLSATLKLSGLPNLQLKDVAGNGPGLTLKLGDSTAGQAGIKGLPGIYLNDGKVPYGIPGLPGIYTGGPGQGSGLTNSKLTLKTGDSDTGAAPTANIPAGPNEDGLPSAAPADATNGPAPAPSNESGMQLSGLQLKTGDNAGAAAQATMLDPSKMTPQQLADVAEQVSKLPPEEQQRLMTAAQNDAAAGQLGPDATAQPSAMASLGQQAAASQAAASAPTLEDASAGARAGFDTPLGPGAKQPATFTTTSSQPSPASSQTPASAETVSRDRTAGSPARPGMTAPPIVTAPPAATSSAAVRPSPSLNPAILPTPLPGGTRHIESVGECLSRYAHNGPSGSAPSLEDLHKKLELERGALEKLLKTQKRENEDRNEWLKEMRKAAQDVAFSAIDKGVEGLFDSSKEALQNAEIGLHEEIQETTKEARELRQQMDEVRKAMGTAKDDPTRLASLQSQWADMEQNQIQPLLENRKALEGRWESTFNWETRVEGITDARDFGAWLTDMELPCDYEKDQVTCKNFKENNAISKTVGGDYETGLDGLKMALKYAAHHAEQLKKLSNAAVIGTTAGKIAANATFVGEVWDTTSLMIDLSYDATVGYLGYQRLQQVQRNDAQFEKAKSILGARIDRMNAEASCYRNAN